MNRPLFLQPWWVRTKREIRKRRAESMAIPNLRVSDPSQRPISVHKIYLALIVFAVALGMWLGEGVAYRAQQKMQGLYSPTPPMPRVERDCSVEGLTACRAQKRMGKVKAT